MKCPHCGVESVNWLKYCTHCGGSLPAGYPDSGLSPSKMTGAVWAFALATVAVTLGGLGIIFSFVFDILNRPGYPSELRQELLPIAAMMIVFGSGLLFGVIVMLYRLISRILAPRLEFPVANPGGVPGRSRERLAEPPIVIPSVTEHTTRTFRGSRDDAPGETE